LRLSSWFYKLHKRKATMMNTMFVVMVLKCATQKKRLRQWLCLLACDLKNELGRWA
jgi:hypothetical protein